MMKLLSPDGLTHDICKQNADAGVLISIILVAHQRANDLMSLKQAGQSSVATSASQGTGLSKQRNQGTLDIGDWSAGIRP